MQDAFMAIMSEDIAFGPFCGRDLFAMYHHLHSPWTKSVVFHLKSIRIVSRDDDTGSFSIVVSGVNRSPMTLSILRFIYPAGLKYPELVDKLVGQPWSFHGSIIAEFDARSQIVRYDPDLDFLGGLSQLMGDSLRAAELMKEAVKDQCGIIYWYDRVQAEASIRAPRIEEVFQLEPQPPSSKERQSVQFLLS